MSGAGRGEPRGSYDPKGRNGRNMSLDEVLAEFRAGADREIAVTRDGRRKAGKHVKRGNWGMSTEAQEGLDNA